MKLVRFGPAGQEKPGVLDQGGTIRDVSSILPDFFGEHLSDAALDKLRSADLASLPAAPDGSRLGAVVPRAGNFICIGLNYVDHAHESNLPIPSEPIVFNKAPSSLSGPFDPVVIPKNSEKTDWEVEIAVVIGKEAYNISEADALSYLAGYTICNDVSERAWQTERGGQWTKGKSAPTFGPVGPWLVTRDEIADPQALDMWLDVNGERTQTGNTSTMIFTIAHVIAYLSTFMKLEPGDIVTTGTPPGVGMGKKPPRYLKPGDKVTLGIQGLGEQAQDVVAYHG
ncbi:fumarylacetoacetate hydrolase family protein [Aureimonas frigidaquae]|uniref:2-keto-4-pentenoate hydratase/2-oxohepta-3-ene-1,7-dioic acid hydratase n=1 Tax=Aureimonas frigidaquae TaxID=424757 RepID=A0A0P0Z2F0_9HYPH|nr:fumarylacetoacetate hydrolase family protein [Aureimonas frigidaquae]BAT28102.1 2-keto-4-pentenoate hydratase/2-oxohepta-3-ene-1,7-dioic acid hydratase [Aureimonas frigidaquae]